MTFSVGQPLVHLLGGALQQPNVTESGYTLMLQVKPYLSNTQCGELDINLTHDIGGRFKNAFDKVKKYSTIFVTGLLYYVNHQLHCEVIEFQFINTKVDNNSSAVNPWKIEKANADKKAKDPIQNRIAVIKASATPDSTTKKTKKPVPIRINKINEVAKTLLTSPKGPRQTGEQEEEKTDEIQTDFLCPNESIGSESDTVDDQSKPSPKKHNTRTRVTSQRNINKRRKPS